jgi:hypothetical protein
MTDHPSITKLLLAVSAPVLWFAHFSVTYALASICDPPSSLISVDAFVPIVTGLSVVAVASLMAIAIAQYRSQRTDHAFLTRMGLGLTALSAVALAWGNLSFLFVPVCEGQ